MKIPKKQKSKKITAKKKPIEKSKKGKVLIVAQEIKFARLLAGNEKKSRDRVLKTLKKWLVNCFAKEHDFKESDFIRIWKGLFYAVWMSDKPLVQEELCENIASTLDTFPPEQLRYALMMASAGYQVLAKEWFGIDLHRLDKFLMLVRRLLRGILRCLKRCEWSDDSCQMFTKVLFTGQGLLATETPVYARNSTSMILHIIDCYLEEICKVSKGSIPSSAVTILFTPIASLLTFSKNMEIVRAARRTFAALIRQSDEGLEYQEKQEAWKRMGCPAGGPDALELTNESDDEEATEQEVDDSDNEDDSDSNDDDENGSEETESVTEENDDDNVENGDAEGPLDPRAGRVNVILNTIPVPSEELVAVLKASLAKCGSKAQKRTRIVMERLEALSSSRYPFPLVVPAREKASGGNRTRALALVRHEQRINKGSDELGLSGLSRKQKKRLLAQSRAGLSIVEEVEALKSKLQTNGKRSAPTTESSEPPKKKPKQSETKDSCSNKENVQNDKKKRKKQKQKPDKPQTQKENVPQKQKENIPQKSTHQKEKPVAKSSLQVKNKVEKPQKTNKIDTTKQNGHIKVKDNKNSKNTKESMVTDKKQHNKKTIDKPSAEKQSVIAIKQTKTKSDYQKLDESVKNKIKNYQKPTNTVNLDTPKKVKFVLKNNSMQAPVDYYKSVRKSPSIPFDSSKQPTKTNLKPSTPSPINPFFKKKMKLKNRF